MTQPFIFISTFRLKQGELDAFKEMCTGLASISSTASLGVPKISLSSPAEPPAIPTRTLAITRKEA